MPKHRKVTKSDRATVSLHWSDHVRGTVTDQESTLADCLRLPFGEAVAIADSALRHGFGRDRLLAVASGLRGPGAPQARRVAELASAEAANPFESGLRAIAVDVPGLDVRPQHPIYDPGFLGRPDLVDIRLGVVLEADSFGWHGSRSALAADCRRYNRLVAHGWLVLRFSWEDVMHEPGWVRSVIRAVVDERTEHLAQPAAQA